MSFADLTQEVQELPFEEKLELQQLLEKYIVEERLGEINEIYQNSYDDIPTNEITKLISVSGGFDWLNSPEEDVYSINDGVPAEW